MKELKRLEQYLCTRFKKLYEELTLLEKEDIITKTERKILFRKISPRDLRKYLGEKHD